MSLHPGPALGRTPSRSQTPSRARVTLHNLHRSHAMANGLDQ